MQSFQHTKVGPLRTFYDQFADFLDSDDKMEFFSKRTNQGKDTFLHMDIYQTDKLADVYLEDYSIRDKLNGFVIMAFPRNDSNVPIFTFQLGGNGKKSIALLDISPTLPSIDYAPLAPIYEKYKEGLSLDPSHTDWVKSVCSPYLLHCQYGALDTDLFLEAMEAYLNVWITHYYEPAQKLTDEESIESVQQAVARYKRVLHSNDPAYKAFSREWGDEVADAFLYLETREDPNIRDKSTADISLLWNNPELGVIWEKEAQERAMEAPESVHKVIRDTIEQKAAELNIQVISLEVFDDLKVAPGTS